VGYFDLVLLGREPSKSIVATLSSYCSTLLTFLTQSLYSVTQKMQSNLTVSMDFPLRKSTITMAAATSMSVLVSLNYAQ